MRINVLGSLQVCDKGIELSVPGEKLRAILAALAVSPQHFVSQSELIEELWGADSPLRAENSLHGHVARLRRVLSEQAGREELRRVVRTESTGYTLAVPPEAVDAFRFQEISGEAEKLYESDPATAITLLNQALDMWRGPALVDVGQGLICRMGYTRLEERRLATHEMLFEARLGMAQHREIIPELEQFHARYPLHENFCGLLVVALYRSGRQADALAAYHRTRENLSRNLGIAPGKNLQGVFNDVLQQNHAAL